MEKILFEDASLTSQAKVTIDGVDHLVTEAEYSGGTDLNANTFNQLQDNVENAINEVVENGIKRTLLWENASPNNSFSSQEITLLSDDYDELILHYKFYSDTDYCKSLNCLKGHSITIDCAHDYGAGGVYYIANFFRDIKRNSDTSFTIPTCLIKYNTNSTTSDSYLIPLAVYGIKY